MGLGHILGVDFGEAKIGLAIADEETKIAFAYATLPNDKSFFDALREIIRTEKVVRIVFGIARHQKDEQSVQFKESFAQMIREETGLPVAFQDEMFTTKMAQANLIAKGMKKVGKIDDAEAARIILQSWLDVN